MLLQDLYFINVNNLRMWFNNFSGTLRIGIYIATYTLQLLSFGIMQAFAEWHNHQLGKFAIRPDFDSSESIFKKTGAWLCQNCFSFYLPIYFVFVLFLLGVTVLPLSTRLFEGLDFLTTIHQYWVRSECHKWLPFSHGH